MSRRTLYNCFCNTQSAHHSKNKEQQNIWILLLKSSSEVLVYDLWHRQHTTAECSAQTFSWHCEHKVFVFLSFLLGHTQHRFFFGGPNGISSLWSSWFPIALLLVSWWSKPANCFPISISNFLRVTVLPFTKAAWFSETYTISAFSALTLTML